MAFKERITIHKLPILDLALKKLLTDEEYKQVNEIVEGQIIDSYSSAISLCLFAMLLRLGMIDEYNIQEFTSLRKIIPPSIDVFTKLDVINTHKFNDYAKLFNKYHLTEEEKNKYIERYTEENNLLTLEQLKILHGWNYGDFTPTEEEKYILFKAFYFTFNQSSFISSSIELLENMQDTMIPRDWRNNISKCIKICINKFASAYINNNEIIQEIRILNERMCIL